MGTALGALLVWSASIGQPPESLESRYAAPVRRIIDAALAENDAWPKMEALCDGIGHRLSGSPQLERAIEWAQSAMRRDGLEHVRAEDVQVPRWVRGGESCEMAEPRRQRLHMLGLGGSVATPAEGITAEVVCVRDKDELAAVGNSVAGKIVLFNFPMKPYDPVGGTGYGDAVHYRGRGAQYAAQYGARAALIRSVTAHSLRSPHTGAMNYGDARVRVPAAALSVEDAEMIARLTRSGQRVVVTLRMEARDEGDARSANVIGELRGRETPEEYVVIGGHIDSWDVGQGAHDDGGGCVIAMEAVNVLRRLNMIPRRTIRVVLFTNEENGLRGARAYAERHADELPRHVAAIEADIGVFAPVGYSFEIRDADREAAVRARLEQIVALLGPLGSMKVETGHSGADLGPMKSAGFPLLGHLSDPARYFDYHHSEADTLDKVDPAEFSRNVAALAATAYVLADMVERLDDPR